MRLSCMFRVCVCVWRLCMYLCGRKFRWRRHNYPPSSFLLKLECHIQFSPQQPSVVGSFSNKIAFRKALLCAGQGKGRQIEIEKWFICFPLSGALNYIIAIHDVCVRLCWCVTSGASIFLIQLFVIPSITSSGSYPSHPHQLQKKQLLVLEWVTVLQKMEWRTEGMMTAAMMMIQPPP